MQLQHQAEYCETDGRTESKLSLKVKFLINKIAPSRYFCLYGKVWQFRNFVLTYQLAMVVLALAFPKNNPFLPAKYSQFVLPLVYSLLSAKKCLD